jgi:hypothetical protein
LNSVDFKIRLGKAILSIYSCPDFWKAVAKQIDADQNAAKTSVGPQCHGTIAIFAPTLIGISGLLFRAEHRISDGGRLPKVGLPPKVLGQNDT